MNLPVLWPAGLKSLLIIIFISGLTVIVNAILSAKTLGGELGMGLKKIAAGTIIYVILFLTIIAIERSSDIFLSEEQARIYFMAINLFGSILLITGYVQIYRISRKLKLF